jgi:hypothetical protein
MREGKDMWVYLQREEKEGGPFDMVWAAEFLDELADFDRLMNRAVVESGILRHIPRNALGRAGGAVCCIFTLLGPVLCMLLMLL